MSKSLLLALFCGASTFSLGQELELKGKDAHRKYNGTNWVRMQEDGAYPQFVQFAVGQELSLEEAKSWVLNLSKSTDFDLQLVSHSKDRVNQTHANFHLSYKGVPFEHQEVKVHLKANKAFRINGEFSLKEPVGSVPILTEQAALQKALQEVGAQEYKWQNEGEEEHLKAETGSQLATYFPKGEVVYINPNFNQKQAAELVWKFNIYAHKPFSRHEVYVSAITGEIIAKQNLIHTVDSHGTAVTAYSGNQSIVTDSLSATSFRLRESGRGNGINTYNMQLGTNYGSAVDFTDTDNFWNNANSGLDQYATDAHWGAEMTYDYFSQEHGRNSIDGLGFALNSYVHADLVGFGLGTNANAFWDGQRMTYGDGNGSSVTPLTALDIAGHEIAHGLTTFSAGLIYQNESGALNESFSDIFGASIEFFARPSNANWLIGEDIGSVIRSMDNPNAYGDPDCYLGTNWYTGTGDNGGVHINSGVQNFWYYLLSTGGNGVNDLGNSYSVNSIGIGNAGDVAFRNLTTYLSATSEYDDARFYSIVSATDLFGGCSPEVESVTNAWHAVGLGAQYVPVANADFVASTTQICNQPYTVSFTNLSMNGVSFIWDFGDGNTSTSLSPTHTYNDTGSYTVKLIADGGSSCGIDTLELIDYINVNPNASCDVILPSNGTAPTQYACSGRVLDSGGAFGDYSNNEYSTVTIAPPGAQSITLTFNMFDVEAGSGFGCNYDFLNVYDGPTASQATLIGTFCNSVTVPQTITANSGSVTLFFYSDAGLEEAGFDISWNCVMPSSPQASFETNTLNLCAGAYKFTDKSTNNPTNWSWNFGDGNTSTLQNPTHRYTQNGVYNVQLIAGNASGVDSVTYNAEVYVSLASSPLVNDTVVCYSDDVQLSATALNGGTLKWYNQQNGGTLLQSGSNLQLTNVQLSDTFYVEEEIGGTPISIGPIDTTIGNTYLVESFTFTSFEVYQNTNLRSVKVFATDTATRTFVLIDSAAQTTVDMISVFVPKGESRLVLNLNVSPGITYLFGMMDFETQRFTINTSGLTFPYTEPGLASITGSFYSLNPSVPSSGVFYDWEFGNEPCYSERKAVEVHVDFCGGFGDNLLGNSIAVYPNPSLGQVQIDLSEIPNQVFEVKVLSIIGQNLVQKTYNGGSVGLLNLSSLAPGNYTVIISSDDIYERRQLVIN